jgi:HEAT repeat protein
MRFPTLDAFSFWLGFAVAMLIAWALYASRRHLQGIRDSIGGALRRLADRLTSGTERNWRDDVHRYAQTLHLAGGLFPLDDILIPPRFFAPDPPIDPARPPADDDLNTVIPIFPDWPDLAAIYRAPTISLEQAFVEDKPVVVLGGPGTGKTVTLAHLASRAALGDETLFPDSPTPIFIHVADLDLPLQPKQDVADPLIAAAQLHASALTATNLARHLRGRLQRFRCVIFLDGFDELPPTQIEAVAGWLRQFKQQYPNHRLIAAAGVTGFGPLTSALSGETAPLGFGPLYLAPPTADDQRALVKKWNAAWEAARARSRRKASPADIDPHITLGWLSLTTYGRSLFELTLRLMGVMIGDARGAHPADWLEAHLLRQGVTAKGQAALGKLGLALVSNMDSAGLSRAAARDLVAPCFLLPNGDYELDANAFLDQMVNRRILVRQGKDRIAFRHNLLAAYCAATALATQNELPKPEPNTPLWPWTLYFLASLSDMLPAVKHALTQPADVLYSDSLNCARWLRDAPANAVWRGEVFKRLSQLLLNPNLPETLRARALTAFVSANDATISALFRQALTSPDPYTRRAAALGLGALGDNASISSLTALFNDEYLEVRWAAALALVNIGSDAALQALRQGLHTGDDVVRQACAQALARNAEVGYEFLREALESNDLATRRAAVYGLGETRAPWAASLLEEKRKEEREWIVRNAIEAVAQQLTAPAPQAPQPFLPPESQGWLVEWAAGQQIGVPPGKGAVDVLNRALKEGAEPIRLAAAEALARLADPASARELYTALRSADSPLVREAAFRGLAHVAAATGQRMMMPVTGKLKTNPPATTAPLRAN